jgi:hypothetical protein
MAVIIRSRAKVPYSKGEPIANVIEHSLGFPVGSYLEFSISLEDAHNVNKTYLRMTQAEAEQVMAAWAKKLAEWETGAKNK